MTKREKSSRKRMSNRLKRRQAQQPGYCYGLNLDTQTYAKRKNRALRRLEFSIYERARKKQSA